MVKKIKDVKKGKGRGYVDDCGFYCMEKCFNCGRENWALAVATGRCAWCGYDANPEEEEDNEKD